MKRWMAAAVTCLAVGGMTVPAAARGEAAAQQAAAQEVITAQEESVKADPGAKRFTPQPAVAANVDADGDRIYDNLAEALATADPKEKFDVIVQLAEPVKEETMAALSGRVGAFAVRSQWDEALNGFAAALTAEQIKALAAEKNVLSVELDLPVQAFLNTATQWTGVQKARTDFGVDGDGDGSPNSYSRNDVVVAVIDTGIDAGHVDLDGGKVIAFRDEVNGRTAAYDDQGHGTHVASIVAGTGEGNASYKGVAPGAALVGIKVLNRQGSGTTSDIIDGINWMISNRSTYNIKIGNMSLGSTGCSDGRDSLSTAVNNASTSGILMMVAAGNSGPGKCTIGAPGAASGAVTVGAGVDPGEKGWGLASFSSRGLTADGRLKPDLVTPGTNIMAARQGSGNGYVAYSGTSMATPFAAGVAALLLDADPGLSVSGLKSILSASGNLEDWGPSGQDLDYGRGLLLPYNAVRQADGGSGNYDDGLAHSYVSGSLSATGQNYYWDFAVTDASKPVAVTMLMPNHTCGVTSCSPDFDLYLVDPAGSTVARSEGTSRQEQVNYQPTRTGTYRVRVYSYSGTGPFFFDASYR